MKTIALVLAFLGGPPAPAGDPEPPAPFAVARFRDHAAYLASDELMGRGVGAPGGRAATEYVAKQFRALGLEPLGDAGSYFQEFRAGDALARNVIGLLPGRGDLADRYVLVLAHHDHLGTGDGPPNTDVVYNGADDNASGVAALLLIAEDLARNHRDEGASRRGLIFVCTDAEEIGLLGARHYAEHPPRPLDRSDFVLNLDMVGRLRGGTLYANDAESCPDLAEVLRRLGAECGVPVETRIGGGNRSDQLIFLERRIPSAHFVTGIHSDYHTPDDEVERLDHEGGARAAWLGARFVRHAVGAPGPFEFRPIAPAFDVQHALGLVSRLGLIPELNTQDGRYPQIAFVVPGSPAAKAGLRGGDRITAFNGLKINRVEDAIVIFSQLDFDRGLRLTVHRGEDDVEIEIPAEVFARFAGPASRPVGDDTFEVTFRFRPPIAAKAVYLAGTFNDWKPTAHKMDGPDANGRFTTTLTLKKGVYEYKFVTDGKDWHTDPDNLHQVGPYHNSVVWVGQERETER